jgi:DNA-binding NarL/FixJ family response regulator
MSGLMTAPRTQPARVLIVDDHEIVRRGLADTIERESDFTVCGEAADGPSALSRIRETDPDVVVTDLSLREGDGLELIKQIRVSHPRVRVLVVSMHDENLYAERAIRAGAMGFVSKNESAPRIIEAMRDVVDDRVHVSKHLADRLLQRMRSPGPAPDLTPIDALSDREIEVLDLLGQGLSTREVAERLHLAPKTVHTYREHLKEKLGLRSAAELIRHAVARKILGD